MVPHTLEFTLLIITTFHNGSMDIAPMPERMTKTACTIEAQDKRIQWKLFGNREFAKSVHYGCIQRNKK